MNQTKSWYTSKTVIAGIVAVLAGGLGFFGYQVGGEDQATIVELVAAIGSTVAGLGVIYGRVKATKAIK